MRNRNFCARFALVWKRGRKSSASSASPGSEVFCSNPRTPIQPSRMRIRMNRRIASILLMVAAVALSFGSIWIPWTIRNLEGATYCGIRPRISIGGVYSAVDLCNNAALDEKASLDSFVLVLVGNIFGFVSLATFFRLSIFKRHQANIFAILVILFIVFVNSAICVFAASRWVGHCQ